MSEAYVPNMTKRPIEMLLGLINADNNLSLTEADIAVRNVTAEPNPDAVSFPDHNTSIEMDLITNDVQDDYVKFYFERISLVTLFNQIDPDFREVDVPLDENGIPADSAVFWAELSRKFGITMNDVDFTYTLKSFGIVTVTANLTNVAYIGSVDVDIVNSLATRIATTTLDGFVKA